MSATSYYKEEIPFPSWLVANYTWWPYLNGSLQLIAVVATVIPILLAQFVYGGGLALHEIILVVLGFAAASPFFLLAWFWHPCPVHKAQDCPPATIDVCVTLYKERLEVIRGTLQACQKIQVGRNTVQIYALDDGNRPEVAQLCQALNKNNNDVPIHYVSRETNRGRKGGNLNDWLHAYATVASEFFIVLDADMQPYPDMVATFLGHYYGFSQDERESIAYIQTPQHFCNQTPFFDVYDVGMAVMYKTMFVAMDKVGVAMCFGTGTFWRRVAVTSVGGFDEVCASEDSVTGCKVHRANNRLEIGHKKNKRQTSMSTTNSDSISEALKENNENPDKVDGSLEKKEAKSSSISVPKRRETQWISKFLKRPVSVGISPRNLPELFDQRLRWAVAGLEVTTTHHWFFFAKELSYSQQIVYWATIGYWFYGMLAFFVQVVSCITVFYFIGISGCTAAASDVEQAPAWTRILPMISAMTYVVILPTASIQDKIASIPIFFAYTPTYVLATLKHMFGVPICVQDTCSEGEEGKRCWHWMFSWHLATLAVATCGAIVAGIYCAPTATNYAMLVIQVGLWVGFYFPVYVSILTGTQVNSIAYWYGGNEASVGV